MSLQLVRITQQIRRRSRADQIIFLARRRTTMKRRLFALLMAAVMMLSLTVTASAATTAEKRTADALYSLGLFLGTGNNSDGTPVYELDNNLTRAQAIVLLVRMLGKENIVASGNYTHPFKDTAAWYDKYVGYAYTNKLTNGTGAATYSGGDATTAQMFATFCLRSLGYDDSKGDFSWDKASDKAKELGVSIDLKGDFTRGDAVETFWDTLNTKMKGSQKTLAEKLESDGVFTKTLFNKAIQIEQGKSQLQINTPSSGSGSGGGSGSSSGSTSTNPLPEDNEDTSSSTNSPSTGETTPPPSGGTTDLPMIPG